MRKNLHDLLLLVALLVGLQATAAVPSGYYTSAQNKSNQALMVALHKIINGHTKRSYDDVFTDFKTTDCNGNTIIDRYSTTKFTYGTNKCGNYSAVGDCYNREHSIPNSWWGGTTDTMYTDLFHLYPVDGYVNGKRSNYPFGDCDNGTTYGTGKLGTCTFSGYTGTVFEPADEYKGDFARTVFYMATRYMNKCGSWTSSPGNAVFTSSTYKRLTTWAINQMLEWHRNDPVSTLETTRNDAVYGIQGNRNPFIDNPDLVEYIWGNKQGNAWGDSGGGSSDPVLNSPTSGSTVNVGTNTGSGVSKTLTISASNLTKALTISVSGSGFSVSPTSVTAANANSGTSVTVTYNGTATSATGTLTISSSEVSATVYLTASYSSGSSGGGSGDETIETWETGNTYTSYSTTYIQGAAFAWNTSDVGIWSTDTHRNDALSCRFGKTSSSYIEMAEDVSGGASKVTFYACKWSANEETPTLQLLYSTNSGSSWTAVGTCSLDDTWKQYSFDLNVSGNVRFKILQTAGARLNIDDIAITGNSGTTANPTITAPTNGSTVNVGTISATGTSVSKTITVKGSDLSKALSVSVSGTGFSVSPTTISASTANSGTTITVTYTSTTSGDATGTLTIGSSEASVTVNLTASKTANPTITAPTSGSTVNVGTISATGTSVSTTITVKGSDLSRALSVSVSGTGFSVSPTTISASTANSGTTITVTYTSTTSGDATGTLTIGSSEASVTVNLTAYKTPNPTITMTSIDAMEAQQGEASSIVTGTVEADDNSNQITLTVEGNFELSLNRRDWSSQLTLDPTGEVFYVRLADTSTAGDYYGSITATTGVVSAYADVQGTVLAPSVLVGDVNMDGRVDVADVSDLISYILGKTVSPFNIDAAYVNDDDKIDVADISALIDNILGKRTVQLRAWDALPDTDGIEVLNPDLEQLEIYDFDADCVAVVSTATAKVQLPAGVYIVATDAASRKVVVK